MWTEKIIGPPGTGKTAALIGRVEGELGSGVEPERLGYYSFTRAAARVAQQRAQAAFPGYSRDSFPHFRTLHSEAFRQLQWSKDKVMAGKHLQEFSKTFGYEISQAHIEDEDIEEYEVKEAVLKTLGDYLLFFTNWRANLMLDFEPAYRAFWVLHREFLPDGWSPGVVRLFEERYRGYKGEKGLLDFNDMLTRVLEEGLRPDLDVLVFDEAQDSSPLQYKVLDFWLQGVKRHYIAGDPDQCLFQWMGTDPDILMGRPCDKLTALGQSYRVPEQVHRLATGIIHTTTEYRPRPAAGEVHQETTLTSVLDRFTSLNGNTAFILVRNLYLLGYLIAGLYQWGIPFENLRGAAPFRGKTATRILIARKLFRGEPVPAEDLWLLVKDVPQKPYFLRGFKAEAQSLAKEQPQLPVRLEGIREYCLESFLGDPIGALGLSPQVQAYFKRVIQRYGESILLEKPRVTIGTIHCSPPDEPVLLANGFRKPIGEIFPEWDHLVSFDENTNRMTLAGHGTRRGRRKRGLSFKKGVNLYEGNLIVMETSASKCRVTPYHRVRVRFGDAFYDKWVVYLMRRGNWWRIGVTKSAHRPYISGGIKGRLASEKADAAWILGLYDTEHEARVAEAKLQGCYGLPGLTFESISKERIFTSEDLFTIHQEINQYITPRVAALLNDFGLYADWPLYSRDSEQKRQYMVGHWFETAAANVLDSVMEVPVWDKEVPPPEHVSPEGKTVHVTKEYYKGPVVSLEVPPYGYYISGNQVVHNSVKGMEANYVAVCSDMSRKTWDSWQKAPDEEKRVWYVAATRAREGLFLIRPWGEYFWSWPKVKPWLNIDMEV